MRLMLSVSFFVMMACNNLLQRGMASIMLDSLLVRPRCVVCSDGTPIWTAVDHLRGPEGDGTDETCGNIGTAWHRCGLVGNAFPRCAPGACSCVWSSSLFSAFFRLCRKVLAHFSVRAGRAASVIGVGMISLERAMLVDHHQHAPDIANSRHIQADQVGVVPIALLRRSMFREGEMRSGL